MKISLREINIFDIDWILRIVNQPSSRKCSFYGKIITPEKHKKHWKKRLNERKKSWAILYDNIPVGVIKMDDGNVSIVIDEKYRRKGIAYSALRKFNLKNCTAQIKPDNETSIKLFAKLGFKEYKRLLKK